MAVLSGDSAGEGDAMAILGAGRTALAALDVTEGSEKSRAGDGRECGIKGVRGKWYLYLLGGRASRKQKAGGRSTSWERAEVQ